MEAERAAFGAGEVIVKILLFGATGMIGQGVLRWLITSPDVDRVVAVSRKQPVVQHAKLSVVIEEDMFHLQEIEALKDFDACFFCLGVSSVGLNEVEYRRITRDLTLAVARQLLPGNPRLVFEFISGEHADLNGRQMWRRVKAETEDAVLAIGFHDTYVLRPGFIQPMRGAVCRNRSVRWIYSVTALLYPYLQKRFDRAVTSTDLLANAMLRIATTGNVKKTLGTFELNQLAKSVLASAQSSDLVANITRPNKQSQI